MKTSPEESVYNFRNPLPANFIVLGITSLVIGISFLFPGRYLAAGILTIVGLGLISVRSGIGINLSKKKIRYLKSIFGIEFGSEESFRELQSLRIKSAKYSQTMNTRANSSTFSYNLYTLCLFADDEIYELKSSKKRQKVEDLMQELCEKWNIAGE